MVRQVTFARRDASAVTSFRTPTSSSGPVLADLAGAATARARSSGTTPTSTSSWATGTPRTRRTSKCRTGEFWSCIASPVAGVSEFRWTARWPCCGRCGRQALFAQTYLDLSEALQDAGLVALDPPRKLNDAMSSGDLRAASGLLHGPRVGAQRGRRVAGGGRLSRTSGRAAAVRSHHGAMGALAYPGRPDPHARGRELSAHWPPARETRDQPRRSSSLHTSSSWRCATACCSGDG